MRLLLPPGGGGQRGMTRLPRRGGRRFALVGWMAWLGGRRRGGPRWWLFDGWVQCGPGGTPGGYQGVKFLTVSMVRSSNAMDSSSNGWRRSTDSRDPSGGWVVDGGRFGCSPVTLMGALLDSRWPRRVLYCAKPQRFARISERNRPDWVRLALCGGKSSMIQRVAVWMDLCPFHLDIGRNSDSLLLKGLLCREGWGEYISKEIRCQR